MTGGTVLTGGTTAGGNIAYNGCLIIAGSVQYVTCPRTKICPPEPSTSGPWACRPRSTAAAWPWAAADKIRTWTIADGPAYYDLVVDAQLDPSGQDGLTKQGGGGLYLGCAAFTSHNFGFGTVTLAAGNLGLANSNALSTANGVFSPLLLTLTGGGVLRAETGNITLVMPACITGGVTLGGRRDLPGMALTQQPGVYTPSPGCYLSP